MCVKSRDSNWEVPPRQIDCCLISEPDSLVGYGSKLTPRSPPVASLATYEVICACNLVGTMVHAPTRPLDFVSTGQVLRQREKRRRKEEEKGRGGGPYSGTLSEDGPAMHRSWSALCRSAASCLVSALATLSFVPILTGCTIFSRCTRSRIS